MKVNLKRLRSIWREEGHTDKEIAELIGMHSRNLTKKFNGKLSEDISATQFAIICEYIEKPMDMFILKES